MKKNLKLFLKSISFSNMLLKIFIIFFLGLLSRFLFNYIYDYTLLIELLSLFSIPLCINLFSFQESIDSKFFDDNNLNFKRPRDRIINNDYEFKNKCRRKCHWIFSQQFSSKFVDFKDFKNHWTPEEKYINILKDKYSDKKYKVVLFKKTFMWFLNVRNR